MQGDILVEPGSATPPASPCRRLSMLYYRTDQSFKNPGVGDYKCEDAQMHLKSQSPRQRFGLASRFPPPDSLQLYKIAIPAQVVGDASKIQKKKVQMGVIGTA